MYDFLANAWRTTGSMTAPRLYAAASAHPDLGIAITGGRVARPDVQTSSVESTHDGAEFKALASLPDVITGRAGHCQV